MGKTKSKIWTKDFFIVFLINAFSMAGFQMLSPNMAEYASALGAGTGILGSVTAVFSMAALAARPFSGKAADRLDNKRALILALAGTIISLVLNTHASTVVMFLAMRFIHGVFFGMSTTLTMTMASRTLPDERIGAGMGVFGLGTILASTVAPSLGIYIAGSLGFTWLFYSSALLSALSAFLVFFMSMPQRSGSENDGAKTGLLRTFFAPEALGPATIAFLQASALGAINTFLLMHAKERGIENIGLYFTVNAVTLVALRPFYSKIMDKVPMKFIIYPCSISMIGSMILISVSRSLPGFLFAAVLYGIGGGGASPALQTMCLKSVENERRGAASGTYYMGLDVGNTVGPLACGMIAGSFSYGSAFMSMVVPIALGMAVMFFTDRHQKRAG